jgi:hypothetical protein
VRGPLYLVGKLGGLGRLNTVAAGQLIHMLDQVSNRRFGVSSWELELLTASCHIALLYLPRARSCNGRRVSLFLAGETAW